MTLSLIEEFEIKFHEWNDLKNSDKILWEDFEKFKEHTGLL